MAQLIRESNELEDAYGRKLQQQDEAQRAGQPGPAAKFGEQAAELGKRRLEVKRRIEALEGDEGGGSAG
jgi:hypothetical protein